MNEHSFKKEKMARNIDHTKLDAIKESAMQLVVEKGYGGASISQIAKKAKVAEGYLYRFYSGKEGLVSDLLNTKVNEVADRLEHAIENGNSFGEIVELVVRSIFQIAKKSVTDIKFMYIMMNDYSFAVNSDLKDRINLLCKEANNLGRKLQQLDPLIDAEELYFFTVIYPIQYINLRLKNFFGNNDWDSNDIENLIKICNKTLSRK